jgi:hypothetical protein
MKSSRTPLGALALTIVVGLSTGAHASDAALLSVPRVIAKNHQPDVMVARGLRSRPIGGNIYLAKPSVKETLFRTPGARVISFFRVQNDTRRVNAPTHSLFLVRSDSTAPKTGVTYLNNKGKNVTAQLARGRYVLNIPAGAERVLTQKISSGPTGAGSFGIKAQHRGTRRSDTAQVTLRKP